MLSRYVRHATGFRNVNHWYRVINSKRDLATGNQTVTLDGPDWNFNYPSGYATTPEVNSYSTSNNAVYNNWTPYIIADAPGNPATIPFSSNTYATMVEGVVSVTERIVKLSDL